MRCPRLPSNVTHDGFSHETINTCDHEIQDHGIYCAAYANVVTVCVWQYLPYCRLFNH